MDLKLLEKSVKVEDNHIILSLPHAYDRYGKQIMVKQVNYFYDWENLAYLFGIFFKYYYAVCNSSKLPDRLSDLEELRNNVQITIGANKKIFKLLIKICNYAEVKDLHKSKKIRWKTRWMKKHFSIDDWCELFVKIYLYNIKGVKKNLQEGLYLLSSHQSN